MKKILDLIIPENDAENFIKSSNKQQFNDIFVAKELLDQIIEPNKYFIIGEKGTGKTAYAVYLSNNNYKETFSALTYIRETEYAKFIEMKKTKNLQLSDYTSVWKVLLLLIVSQEIHQVCRENILQKFINLKSYAKIKQLVEQFTNDAFTPELINVMNLIDNEDFVAKVGDSDVYGGEFQYEKKKETQNSIKQFNLALLKLEKEFKQAINDIKIGKNYILFVDGIDIRPSSITQEDYIECLKGLTNAIWSLNQDYFGRMKDRKGKTIKIMLLIRPDIFMKMDLQNQSTKIYNNAISLDWLTTYRDYRSSKLFILADSILSYNQDEKEKELGFYFDYYHPYQITRNRTQEDHAFIGFLRYSFYRARDIVTILNLMQKQVKDVEKAKYNIEDFQKILPAFSRYLLMEVRDYFKFYYTEEDFDFLRNFLILLHSHTRFTIKEFQGFYDKYTADIISPDYAKNYKDFLQFLYELNVIGYYELDQGYKQKAHWCFRERDMSNPTPKISYHATGYLLHHGLHAALRL